jgi:hypothetical protein
MDAIIYALLIFFAIVDIAIIVKLFRIANRANKSIEKWLKSEP